MRYYGTVFNSDAICRVGNTQVNVGEPHLPASFGGHGRSNILPSNVEAVAGDHDLHVVNFTPSVCLHVDIKPDEGEDMILYYRGKSFILE